MVNGLGLALLRVTTAPGVSPWAVFVVIVEIPPLLVALATPPPTATPATPLIMTETPGISPCAVFVVIVARPGRFSLLMTICPPPVMPPPIAVAGTPATCT